MQATLPANKTTSGLTINGSAFGSPEQAIARIKKEYGGLTVRDDGIETVAGGLREIKALCVGIEKTRVELKAESLAIGRTIDSLAKGYIGELLDTRQHLQEEVDVHAAGIALAKQEKVREAARKVQERVNRLTAAGAAQIDMIAVQSLTDGAFDIMVAEAEKEAREAAALAAIAEAVRLAAEEAARTEAARLEEIRLEVLRQQHEELRIRAEELEAERAANQAALDRERAIMQAAIDEERAEIAARQAEEAKLAHAAAVEQRQADDARAAELAKAAAELAKEKAELKAAEDARKAEQARLDAIQKKRIRDEEEAENLRRWNTEQARIAAEAETRRQALLPEIAKAELLATELDEFAEAWFQRHGTPVWAEAAMIYLNEGLDNIVAHVKGL